MEGQRLNTLETAAPVCAPATKAPASESEFGNSFGLKSGGAGKALQVIFTSQCTERK
jgi:hypothetical protein